MQPANSISWRAAWRARMGKIRRSRPWLSLASALTLAGCHTPAPRVTVPMQPPAQPDAYALGGSYDWHGLLKSPFGSMLKDIPERLHEVLMFHDEARGAADEDAECYSSDGPAPRFAERTADEYLLCFKQDRLSRVQASLRLPAAEAPQVFAAACTAWLKNAAQARAEAAAPAETAAASSIAAPGTETPRTEAQGAEACDGRDGPIRFSGRLEEQLGQAETVLFITLDSVPTP